MLNFSKKHGQMTFFHLGHLAMKSLFFQSVHKKYKAAYFI